MGGDSITRLLAMPDLTIALAMRFRRDARSTGASAISLGASSWMSGNSCTLPVFWLAITPPNVFFDIKTRALYEEGAYFWLRVVEICQRGQIVYLAVTTVYQR